MAWGGAKSPKISKFSQQALRSIRLPAGLSHGPLFLVVLGLSLFGLLMIYSSSAVLGMQSVGDAFFFARKQALFLLIGWIAYFVIAEVPVHKLTPYRLFFLFAGLALLLAVLVPGLGSSGGGAQRWLQLGPIRFQPAEIARLFLIIYLAGTLARKADRLKSFNKGFLPLLIVTSVFMFLLLLQPDFGGAMSIFMISVALWFIGGVSWTYLTGLAILALPALIFVLWQAPYRVSRVMTFLDPWKDAQGAGFQVIQSFSAFYEGGWTGVGLGNSEQKLFYLPKAHTDFIFSVLGEELGVLGVALVCLLFVALLVFGARIARDQKQISHYLLAIGLTVLLVLPALLNMAVTLGLLPTKGLPLPFFSSGGSSLVVSLMAAGMLQSLKHHKNEEAA